jgi:hypothetical protein
MDKFHEYLRVSSLHDLIAFMAAFTSISSVQTWLLMKLLWKHLARASRHPMNDLLDLSFKIASSRKGWSTYISSSFLAWGTNLFVQDAFVNLMHFILVLSIASSAKIFYPLLPLRCLLGNLLFCLFFDRRLPNHGKWIKCNLKCNIILITTSDNI